MIISLVPAQASHIYHAFLYNGFLDPPLFKGELCEKIIDYKFHVDFA